LYKSFINHQVKFSFCLLNKYCQFTIALFFSDRDSSSGSIEPVSIFFHRDQAANSPPLVCVQLSAIAHEGIRQITYQFFNV